MTFGFQRHSFLKFSNRTVNFLCRDSYFTVAVGHVHVRAKYVGASAGSMWLRIGTGGIHL